MKSKYKGSKVKKLLHSIDLLKTLTNAEFNELWGIAHPVEFNAKAVIMKEGEVASWPVLVRNVLVVLVISAVVVLGLQLQPNLKQIRKVLIYLPAILIGAVINAFGEEYEFRSIYLARLLPVLGKQQSIFITSALFGLLHYFGNPGSIPGVLMAGYLGYISAKSMVETRGFVWALLIHFIGDIIVYAFWSM